MTGAGQIGRRPLTADDAAAELRIPKSLIKVWKHRGRVVPVGIADVHQAGSRDVPLYDLEELRPLAEAWRARRADTT